MARVLLAALHTFIAATLALGGLVLLVQCRLAVTWEMGFYGKLSLVTTVLLVTSVVALAIAVVQGVSSFGYALGQRWGAWGLLFVSVCLALVLPTRLSWILALGAAILVIELWSSRARPFPGDGDVS